MGTSFKINRVPREESRKTDSAEYDHISNLPNCVISHILSCLDMKDAVRTSVLSRDWEFKWISINKIHICDGRRSRNESKKDSFANFVEKTLLLTHNVQSFRLTCVREYDLGHVKTWISNALSSNLHCMGIYYPYAGIVLPQNLLKCCSLRELHLNFHPCTFKVPTQICFPHLKTLILIGVEILNENPDSDLVKFHFPVLERFDLTRCKWLNVKFVEIYSPKVTNFMSEVHDVGVNDYSIKIIGDNNLLRFEFSDVLPLKTVISGSPVVSAALEDRRRIDDIRLLEKGGLQIRKLLKGLLSLEDLELSSLVGKAIAQSKRGLSLPKYYKLKRLALHCFDNTEALLELLHATPYLKFLHMNYMINWNDYDYEAEEYVPPCIVYHLEGVMISGFRGTTNELKLAMFFLKNALQLKSMRICHYHYTSVIERKEIVEELSTYPKASPHLTVKVSEV